MSVDVEDYFQVGAFETTIAREEWDTIPRRVDMATGRVLDLFARKGVKATFFCLGWVAERHPELIRRIADEGHEVASHGYDHARVTSLTPESFRADLRKAKALLEDAGGTPVIGYRAPSFSIGDANLWALEVLGEEGYLYSSSIYPIQHDHYGMPGAPRFAFRPDQAPSLTELPVTTVQVGSKTIPCGGGGYFRLLPYALSRWAMRRVNRRDNQSCIFYFHPWEVDKDQPRQKDAPLKSRLRHYVNLDKMEAKLARALDDFDWGRVDEVFFGAAADDKAA
ncbi:MAG: XrtA system polysaccharide deacetylase [Pseudomonadota bacterium]